MTRRRRRSASQTLGGIIVGFDQQVFRTTPPAHELVEHAQPVRGSTGDDGSDLVITLPPGDGPGEPSDALPEEPRPDEPAAEASHARSDGGRAESD